MTLSQEEISGLLAPKPTKTKIQKTTPRQHLSTQNGPVRFFDIEMRCASRGCSSSTYIKVRGIPKCMIHTIIECNNLLVGAGIE